jgi:hypothetical protein
MIPVQAVSTLAAKFRQARFFALKSQYRADVTDQVTTTLTFEDAGRSKTVEDYAGEMVGMPRAVLDLEQAVDATAGTDRWVKGKRRKCMGSA